jgi:acyl carrier protein
MSDDSLVLREHLGLQEPYLAPRNTAEAQLAEIWRQALNMDRVGVEDRYIDLGGDSFLAGIIFNMIQQRFGIELPMAVLVRAPTIAALAGEIGRHQSGSAGGGP